MIKLSPKAIAGIAVLCITLILALLTFGINNNGYRVVVQWPTGHTFVKFTPGLYWTFFGRNETYKDSGTYTFDDDPSNDRTSTIATGPINVRYNDGGLGTIYGVYRWTLPGTQDEMLTIHRAYRSEAGVANNLIRQTVQESMNLTAALMSSEESYAEKRETYKNWARQQTEKASFSTKQQTVCETNAVGNKECREIAVIKRSEDGDIINSNASPIAEFNIRTGQFQVSKWDYEVKTLAQISKKREATMTIITAKATAEAAKQLAITAEEQGKANVMTAKYEKEVEKVRAVVDAEKLKEVAIVAATQKVAVAAQNKFEAEQKKLAAVEYKQEQILIGEGDGERKRLVMKADGALAQKLEAIVKIAYYNAEAQMKRKVPSVVIYGGSGADGQLGSANDVSNILDTQLLKNLNALSLDINTQ